MKRPAGTITQSSISLGVKTAKPKANGGRGSSKRSGSGFNTVFLSVGHDLITE
jgi:hypothetical protein